MSKKYISVHQTKTDNTYATGGTNEMAQCDKISRRSSQRHSGGCGFDVMVGKVRVRLMQTRCPELG